MPVLPEVGSTMVMPGLSLPLLSASQIMFAPIRHLTEYPGLRPSILASTVTPRGAMRLICTSGVLPMECALSAKIRLMAGSFYAPGGKLQG
ncbi:hypothetical protein D3C76_1355620 [compost metagenome]